MPGSTEHLVMRHVLLGWGRFLLRCTLYQLPEVACPAPSCSILLLPPAPPPTSPRSWATALLTMARTCSHAQYTPESDFMKELLGSNCSVGGGPHDSG